MELPTTVHLVGPSLVVVVVPHGGGGGCPDCIALPLGGGGVGADCVALPSCGDGGVGSDCVVLPYGDRSRGSGGVALSPDSGFVAGDSLSFDFLSTWPNTDAQRGSACFSTFSSILLLLLFPVPPTEWFNCLFFSSL